jgi:hypothetical protein
MESFSMSTRGGHEPNTIGRWLEDGIAEIVQALNPKHFHRLQQFQVAQPEFLIEGQNNIWFLIEAKNHQQSYYVRNGSLVHALTPEMNKELKDVMEKEGGAFAWIPAFEEGKISFRPWFQTQKWHFQHLLMKNWTSLSFITEDGQPIRLKNHPVPVLVASTSQVFTMDPEVSRIFEEGLIIVLEKQYTPETKAELDLKLRRTLEGLLTK